MTLPNELITSLDDLVVKDLQHIKDLYFSWLLVSTVAVAVGVILEGPELIHELSGEVSRFRFKPPAKIRINPSTGLPIISHSLNWRLLISVLGWALVGIGVVGEFALESFVSQADGLLQTFNSILLTQTRLDTAQALAIAEVGKAANKQLSIDLINAKSDLASKQSALETTIEKERQRTAQFEKEAATARMALEKKVRLQGPREPLLEEGKTNFVKAMRQFSGQPITVMHCVLRPGMDPEPPLFAWKLLELIGKEGAGWATGYITPDACPAYGPDSIITVSSAANATVKKAARALHDVLNDISVPFGGVVEIGADLPDQYIISGVGANSAHFLAKKDPTQIFVFILPK